MVLVVVLFAGGIVLDRFLDPELSVWFGGLLIALLGWVAVVIGFPERRSLALLLFLSVFLFSGGMWHHVRWNLFPANHVSHYAKDLNYPAAKIRGTIVSESVSVSPPPYDPHLDTIPPTPRLRFDLKVSGVAIGQTWDDASGQLRVYVKLPAAEQDRGEPQPERDAKSESKLKNEVPQCGAQIEVVGSLVPLKPTTNPGQFDFATHFRRCGRLAALYVDSPNALHELASDPSTHSFRAKLRATIDRYLHQHVPNYAGFASAVLLGNRDQMEPYSRQRFMKTGASHLLAISGLHVGILASAFLILLRLGVVSRRNCLLATMAFVVSYCWLVEFRPTVVRASILICVLCTARILGRITLSWSSLSVALLLVLLLNPTDLFSIGPQLSFLAISSIIIGKSWIFPPPVQDPIELLILRTRPEPVRLLRAFLRQMRAACCVSFLIWLIALPLVAAQFHSIPWIAPLLNPLVILPMSLALYCGLGTIALGGVNPWLASIAGACCCYFLGVIQWLVDFGAGLGFHSWSTGPSIGSLMVFYAGLFIFTAIPVTKVPPRWRVVLAMTWLVFGWLVPEKISQLQRDRNRELEVVVIDVRHGSAALIKLPNGKNILCDGGSLSGSHRAADTIARVLHHQRVRRLDAVVISHADVDHFNGIPELANRFPIDSLWLNAKMNSSDSGSVAALFDSTSRHQIPVEVVGEGCHCEVAGCRMGVLGPPADDSAAWRSLGDNASSVVLSIEYAGKRILLPGDLEELGMEALLGRPPRDYDVLIAAHHGSKNSDPERFARWCTPEFVVASCGARKVGQREKDLFQAGHRCKVLTTHEHGAVRFRVSATGELRVDAWREGGWNPVSDLSAAKVQRTALKDAD